MKISVCIGGLLVFCGLSQIAIAYAETTIDDSDPAVIYSRNNWTAWPDPGDYDKTEHFSHFTTTAPTFQVQGADVVVNFNGTGIQWIGRTGTNFGIAAYSIDGSPPHSFDGYTPTNPYQSINATVRNLTPGSHGLKIELTPYINPASHGNYQVIDGFVITGTPLRSPSVAGYRSVKYTGNWQCMPADTDLSGGHCWSGRANSTVSWTFSGSLVEVYGRPDLEDGIFNVLIDGYQVGQVDGHFGSENNDALNSYCLFVWKGSSGTHTITLVVTGAKDERASDALLQFDEFMAFP